MKNLYQTYENGAFAWRFFYVENGELRSLKFSNSIPLVEIKKKISCKFTQEKKYLIKNIAKDMFLPDSNSFNRRKYRGQSTNRITLEHLRRHCMEIIDVWGEKDLRELNERDFVNYLIEKKRSNSWKNEFLTALREIYDEASWNSLKVVIPNIKNFKREKNKADVFSWSELQVFLDKSNFEDYSMYIFFLLSFFGGLRIGEACGARVSQFQFEKNAFIVDGYIDNEGNRTVYNKKGSAEKPMYRAVILPTKIMALIQSYICDHQFRHNNFIFQTETGNPLTRFYPEAAFEKALIKSGIVIAGRKLVPHSLRYTYITFMRLKFEGELVRKFAGHTNMEMTDYYTRVILSETIDSMQDLVSKIDSFFEG